MRNKDNKVLRNVIIISSISLVVLILLIYVAAKVSSHNDLEEVPPEIIDTTAVPSEGYGEDLLAQSTEEEAKQSYSEPPLPTGGQQVGDTTISLQPEVINDTPHLTAKEERDGTTATLEEVVGESNIEKLTPAPGEGVKMVISKDIPSDYKDSTGVILPQDPKDDKRMKEGWKSNAAILDMMVFEPEDITVPDQYLYNYVPKEDWDNGLKTLCEKYIERSVYVANQKYKTQLMNNSGLHYTYCMNTLKSNEYPEDYPIRDGYYLIEVFFMPEY